MASKGFRAFAVTMALVFAQFGTMTGAGPCECGNADMAPMATMAPASPHDHMPARTGTHQPVPCSQSMSHSECGSMASCGIPVMAASAVQLPAAPVPAVDSCLVVITTPRSVARGPEPPPPRS